MTDCASSCGFSRPWHMVLHFNSKKTEATSNGTIGSSDSKGRIVHSAHVFQPIAALSIGRLLSIVLITVILAYYSVLNHTNCENN